MLSTWQVFQYRYDTINNLLRRQIHIFVQIQQNTEESRYSVIILTNTYMHCYTCTLTHTEHASTYIKHVAGVHSITGSHLGSTKPTNIQNKKKKKN